MKFSEHKSTKNEDGTFNIHEVPIFELGEHRGQSYDQSWMTEALSNFTSLKADKKFLPRVIVGHTNDKEEKPAVGFLDNLKLQGKTVMADLVNLAQKTFDEIRTKAWPSRSVEVNPLKKKFTALALLGGSEPYFQFEPIDVKFEADPDGQWVDFGDISESEFEIDEDAIEQLIAPDQIKQEIEFDKKIGMMDQIWWKIQDIIRKITKSSKTENKKALIKKTLSTGIEVMQSEISNFKEEIEMTPEQIQKMIDDAIAKDRLSQEAKFNQELEEKYQAKFKEQFGKDPKTFLEDIEKEKTAKFAERKKTALDNLKTKYGIAPKLVDGYLAAIIDSMGGIEDQPIKFAEDQQGDIFQLIDKFGEAMAKADAENTLFVDLDEYAKFSGDGKNPNLGKAAERYVDASEDDLKQLDLEIRKFAEANKISYSQAAEQVMAAKR